MAKPETTPETKTEQGSPAQAPQWLIARITARRGAEAARQAAQVLQDPDIAPYVCFIDPDKADGELFAGARELLGAASAPDPTVANDQVTGQLISGMRRVVSGATTQLGCQPLVPDAVPARPREERLLEAGHAFADAKDEERERKMANVVCDTAKMRVALSRAAAGRKLVRIQVRSLRMLMNNLAVWEDDIARVLRTEYPKVRLAAQADEPFGERLEVVDLYLYEPAQQAVQTAREQRLVIQEREASAERRGKAEARRELSSGIADDLVALAEDLKRLSPIQPVSAAPTADERGRTR